MPETQIDPEPFEAFRAGHSLQRPDMRRVRYADELRLLDASEGVREMPAPPASEFVTGKAPARHEEQYAPEVLATKYLWVIGRSGVPIALERPVRPYAVLLERCCHTNLTGGGDAYCGGEMWFFGPSSIVLNGGSGRYQARSPRELIEAVEAFHKAGFVVVDLGWAEGIGRPARVFRSGHVRVLGDGGPLRVLGDG